MKNEFRKSLLGIPAIALLSGCLGFAANVQPTHSASGLQSVDRSLIEIGPSLELPNQGGQSSLPVEFTAFIKTTRQDVEKDSVHFLLYRNGVKVGALETRKPEQGIKIAADGLATELGVYRIDVSVGDDLIGSTGFSIAKVPCIGSGLLVRTGGDGRAEFRLKSYPTGREKGNVTLELHRWESSYESHGYQTEWLHEGKVVFTDKGRSPEFDRWQRVLESRFSDAPSVFSQQNLGACLYSPLESYEVPRELLRRPGAWEVRVLRDRHPPISLSFTVTSDGKLSGSGPTFKIDAGRSDLWTSVPLRVKELTETAELERKLKSVPAWRHAPVTEAWRNLLAVTPEEIRALYRSPELFKERAQLNDKILPKGATRAVLSQDQQRRLSPDQQWHLARKTEHEANVDSSQETAAARANAGKSLKRLRQLIHQYGAPFSADEQPTL